MATGLLGNSDLDAATDTIVYTVPENTFSVVSVNLCNRNSANATNIRVAIADSINPSNSEFIEFDSELIANGVIERSGIVIQADKNIVVRSSTNDVTVTVYGIETSTTTS